MVEDEDVGTMGGGAGGDNGFDRGRRLIPAKCGGGVRRGVNERNRRLLATC